MALKKVASQPMSTKDLLIMPGDFRSMPSPNQAIQEGGDVMNIELRIEQMRSSGNMQGSYDGFFKMFEEYKAAVNKEMLRMRKNMQLMRQENDGLKAVSLELKRKDEQIHQLKKQMEEFDDDHAIIKRSSKIEESRL